MRKRYTRQALERAASGGLLIVGAVVGFAVAVIIFAAALWLISNLNVSHHVINPPANVQSSH